VTTDIAQLIDEGVQRLGRVTDQPRHEAEILLAAALGRPRSYVLAHPEQRILECDATDRYEAAVTRRAQGEPVAYILGEKEFWSLLLEVSPDVLVPRPETELVVELALAQLPHEVPGRVLDVAAGSGAIALAIAHERPRHHVIGTDLSAAAVALARRNAARLGLANVEFRAGSWFEPVAAERFTMIASNPPYIATEDPRTDWAVRRFEPPAALFAGPTGLEALGVLIAGAPDHLLPGGHLVVEHGDAQALAVRRLFETAGFDSVRSARDLAGRDRCTEGRWPGRRLPSGA